MEARAMNTAQEAVVATLPKPEEVIDAKEAQISGEIAKIGKDCTAITVTNDTEYLHGDTIQPGTIVRHFKGKLYQVVGIAVHTETAEEMVIYQALYSPFITYARPKDMFLSKVDEEKYPEHAGEWRLRKATLDEIRGQEGANNVG